MGRCDLLDCPYGRCDRNGSARSKKRAREEGSGNDNGEGSVRREDGAGGYGAQRRKSDCAVFAGQGVSRRFGSVRDGRDAGVNGNGKGIGDVCGDGNCERNAGREEWQVCAGAYWDAAEWAAEFVDQRGAGFGYGRVGGNFRGNENHYWRGRETFLRV